MCAHNNNIPIKIPSHQYVILNRSILCNYDLEAESNFLLESLAACENSNNEADLTMYFTVNLAFVNYLEGAVESLCSEVSTNWTTRGASSPFIHRKFWFWSKITFCPTDYERFYNTVPIQKWDERYTELKGNRENPDRLKIGIIPWEFHSRCASFHSSIDYISCYFSGDVCGVQTIKIKGFNSKYNITAFKSSRSQLIHQSATVYVNQTGILWAYY